MKHKILIVDDVKANIFLIEGYLSDEFTVFSVHDSEGLWKFLKSDTPSLILLDIMLPFENGFEIMRKLKNDVNYSKIPVIFVTAKDDKKDVLEGITLGAKDYIVKPVEGTMLTAKIKKVLNISDTLEIDE